MEDLADLLPQDGQAAEVERPQGDDLLGRSRAVRSSKGPNMKGAFAATLVSIALASSLVPCAAFAQGQQLQAGSAAVSTQSVKPKTPKAAPKSLYSLYKPVLKKAVSGTGVFAKNYAASDKKYWKPTYSVFDVGADGVPDLLVRNGTFTFNSVEDVFTVKSGKVVHMGTYWDGAGGSAGNKKGRLYSAGWRAGTSNVDLVTFKGGKATQKTVATGRATASNPTGELQVVSDYLKKHKATWLTSSSADDYTLLKKKAKITSKKIYDASVSVQRSATYTGKALKPKMTAY